MGWKIVLLMVLIPGVAGMVQLASYSNRPGDVGASVPANYLGELPVTNNAGAATVVFFYHPHCPCTRATIRCLERLVVSFDPKPKIIAYAFLPSFESDIWVESEITDKLRTLGDVTIIADRYAIACRRFSVATSGHVLVYDDAGHLQFSGGITPARGHEGGCASAAAFLSSVNGVATAVQDWPVFGCAIVANSEGI